MVILNCSVSIDNCLGIHRKFFGFSWKSLRPIDGKFSGYSQKVVGYPSKLKLPGYQLILTSNSSWVVCSSIRRMFGHDSLPVCSTENVRVIVGKWSGFNQNSVTELPTYFKLPTARDWCVRLFVGCSGFLSETVMVKHTVIVNISGIQDNLFVDSVRRRIFGLSSDYGGVFIGSWSGIHWSALTLISSSSWLVAWPEAADPETFLLRSSSMHTVDEIYSSCGRTIKH